MRTLALNKNLSLVHGRDGLFLVNRNDVFIGRALELYGEYNGAESDGLRRLVKPGDVVIEVGANIGSHTVGLAKAVGPSGSVFAFEPQRACFALLQAQIALNELTNVMAFQAGVGAENGTLYLPRIDYSQRGNFGGVALNKEAGKNNERVAVTRLDDKFAKMPVTLIKVDAEGMEREVIEGARQIIDHAKPTLYVENDRVEKSPALVALLLELGYRLWWHTPDLYSPTNFFQNSENLYGNIASFNMICLHGSKGEVEKLTEIKSPDDPHPVSAIRARQAAAAKKP